jgi:undecaprenyl-phosphate 4-deoxy-4-formamido-L-arabinose transferase
MTDPLHPDLNLPGGISVVIPIYNSAASLPALCTELGPVLAGLGKPYEIILVNDGSRDASWKAVTDCAAIWPNIRGINLMRNFGQHNALLCGIRLARYSTVVTIDDDLQHPPSEIPALLAKLDEGFDAVYGSPRNLHHGLWRNCASKVTKLALQGAMGAATARQVSAFRAFRTSIRSAFAAFDGPFPCIDVLLTWGTTRFTAIEVRHDPRRIGVSNYTFKKLILHTINMTTGFTTVPLQLASLVGFGCAFFGLLVLAYVVIRFFMTGSVVPGFPFLASIIAIFSGAQLFALGIIGEYLARIHFKTMNRPCYAVSSIIERSDPT